MRKFFSKAQDGDIPKIKYKVVVKTGDRQFAGSDASICIVLHGDGQSSEKLTLSNLLKKDFARGNTDEFTITAVQLNKVEFIELFRGFAVAVPGFGDEWFVDEVTITDQESGSKYIFPIHRWIKPKSSLKISHLDTSLPQFDRFPEQRKCELDLKKSQYQLEVKNEGNPPQVKKVPSDEQFSIAYAFDIGTKALATTVKANKIHLFMPGKKWDSLEHMRKAYTADLLPIPDGSKYWREDRYFGHQRLAAVNSSVIRLCEEIPQKFPVTDTMVEDCLEGLTLEEAMKQKRLFIIDYEIMTGIPTRPNFRVCDPIALFFVNGKKDLMPIAIQLKQKPSEDNPIFLPSDPEYTWMMAKMWFNNADTAYHQSVSHLGFTHLLVEGYCAVTHRQMSLSHPLFKLLAPHFLYVIQINALALTQLVGKGKWIDTTMNLGRLGVFELIKRRSKTWKLNIDGVLPNDFENRGVLSDDVLPKYYFREDTLQVFHAIKDYVTNYVNLYYDTDSNITEDWELQGWVAELEKPAEQGGANINLGIPDIKEKQKIENKDHLISILTSIIYTASVAHGAVNFQQYDEYAYPPNYPAYMSGEPPKNKTALTEKDILDALPDQKTMLSIMTITQILSEKATRSLGYFEVMYMHDPAALNCLHDFQENLQKISDSMHKNAAMRDPPYLWIDPKHLPNAISI